MSTISAAAWAGVGGLVAYLGPVAILAIAMPLFLAARPGRPSGDRPVVAEPAPEIDPPPSPPEPREPAAVVSFDEAGLRAQISGWSDEKLCWAWRSSFTRLQQSGTPVAACIARERQLYLDELERRDPGGFKRWLGSGARAASDPRRHLRSRSRETQDES